MTDIELLTRRVEALEEAQRTPGIVPGGCRPA